MYHHVSKTLHLLILMLFVILIGTCASSVYFTNNEPDTVTATDFGVAWNDVPLTKTDSPHLVEDLVTGTIALTPSFTPAPVLSLPLTPDIEPESGWSLIQPGLERRVTPIYDDQGQQVESLRVWRLDQNYFRLDVAYDETPKVLETWQRETSALMVVNGGFYSVENERYFPDGLTIVNGVVSGRSFNGFGGMLAIKESAAELRWLVQQPYDSSEHLHAALQAFPVLVEPGGKLGFGAERENNVSARRTVIGQDKDGRILFIVAPQGYFTLHQLSAYLTESDLNLDIAINLDGGGSTGILVGNPPEIVPPSRPLPFVILVYAR